MLWTGETAEAKLIFKSEKGFPDGPVVGNPPASASDMGSTPDPEGFYMLLGS